ncbi:AraC family transcriptional regulator [uncultured Litoreibacter sp.]|uniref:helix-turn-helix domain-containing protein n=1 Tax=uncultured Litoreibacter sp. TaxID=1392394 RepID=UPI00260EF518|nr:AraC family transcriptional regulator [uncultured Litoreibacter sp.]
MLVSVGLLALELALFVPSAWSADVVVITENAVFVVLLAAMLRQPQDAFVQVAPHRFRTTRIALLFALLFMALIVAADITILLAMLSAGNAGVIHLLTGASGVVVVIVMLCALIGVPLFLGAQSHSISGEAPEQQPSEEDHELLRRLDHLMRDNQIFTDPDLTLARLGRRLHCPARSVSKAINLIHKENVSRYINRFRVSYAALLLKTTDRPVTDIMLESGFQSKSSFNTEFRRLTGQTPSTYRQHDGFDDNVLNRDLKRSDS